MKFSSLFLIIVSLCLATRIAAAPSFLKDRANFKTTLIHVGPSPQEYQDEFPPDGVKQIDYESGGRSLKAWLRLGSADAVHKHPVLVYFHGGFAFGASDLEDCRKFIDAGFIVFTPTLRGENGNPGVFEMCLGEVDDARASIQWIAKQDFVDKDHIYAFGHSAGGIVATLVSLLDDVPVQITGSSGGLYGPRFFMSGKMAPFDKSIQDEFRFRSIVGNVSNLKHPHFAYAGQQDSWQEIDAVRKEASTTGRIHVEVLPGDHFSCLPACFEKFLKVVLDDIKKTK